MLVISIICTLLAITGTSNCHSHCNPADCTCIYENHVYELDCPKSNVPSRLPKLKVDFQPNISVHLVCTTPLVDYEWLIGFPYGPVNVISFIGCPLPTYSFSHLMTILHMNNVTQLIFQSISNPVFLQHYHLQGLHSIKTLTFSLNGLQIIPQELFKDMPSLTKLDLHSNNLMLHQKLFNNNSNIRDLQLNRNNLSDIPVQCFLHLTKLQILNLAENRLYNLQSETFQGLSNLMSLNLNDNQISFLPNNVFLYLESLQHLFLSGNYLTFLPSELFSSTLHLKKLMLNRNHLKLTSLPSNLLANLTDIQEIYLQDCHIEIIPEDLFRTSENIAIMQLSRNAIKNLHANTFRDLKNLQELDMSYNKLEELPNTLFSSLKKLNRLYLDHNQITTITESSFHGLSNLSQLHMTNNFLNHISRDAFKNTPHLSQVYLSNNMISFDKKDKDEDQKSPMYYCKDLEELHLDQNIIETIFNDWRTVHTKLNVLNLSSNAIDYIKFQDLEFQSNNITIDLTHNKITTVDLSGAEASVPRQDTQQINTVNVKVGNNPLHCNCDIYDLLRYVEYKIAPEVHVALNMNTENLVCSSPQELNGFPISKLYSHVLTCHIGSHEQCPKQCSCIFQPQTMVLIVNCSATGLQEVPIKLPHLHPVNSIELFLDHNNLSRLPEIPPVSYSKVTKLSLSYNSITQLRNTSLPQNLLVLEVDHNNLTHVDRLLVETFSKLQQVTLHDNPWKCTCELQDLIDFLKSNPEQVVHLNGVTCTARYGQILTDLSEKELCSPLHWEVIAAASIAITLAAVVIGILAALYLNYQRRMRMKLYSSHI